MTTPDLSPSRRRHQQDDTLLIKSQEVAIDPGVLEILHLLKYKLVISIIQSRQPDFYDVLTRSELENEMDCTWRTYPISKYTEAQARFAIEQNGVKQERVESTQEKHTVLGAVAKWLLQTAKENLRGPHN